MWNRKDYASNYWGDPEPPPWFSPGKPPVPPVNPPGNPPNIIPPSIIIRLDDIHYPCG